MSTLNVEFLKQENSSSNNVTLDSDGSVAINRHTSDGTIIDLQKDGTSVGGVGVGGGNLFLSSGTSGIGTYADGIAPATSIGTFSAGTKDLGSSSVGWRNLFLSGGVYIGSGAAANYLDDYEEGTWSPQLSDGTTTAGGGSVIGTYTKVGRLVHARFSFINMDTNLGLSGTWRITNLPFSIAGEPGEYLGGFVTYNRGISMGGDWMSLFTIPSFNYFQLRAHYMNGTESAAKGGAVPGTMLFSGEMIYPST